MGKLRKSTSVDREVVDHMFNNDISPSNIKNEKELLQKLNNPKLTIADRTDELSFSPGEMSKTENQQVVTEQDC